MIPVQGRFVVHRDDVTLEVLADVAGPAGAVGVPLCDGLVDVELDGADVDRLVGVRLHLDAGGLVAAQEQFVRSFFGPLAGRIVDAATSSRPVAVGSRAVSSRAGVHVDPAVTLTVVGADALARGPLPMLWSSLLALSALVGEAESGLQLEPGLRQLLLGRLVDLPRMLPLTSGRRARGVPDEMFQVAYRDLLGRAAACELLAAPPPELTGLVHGPVTGNVPGMFDGNFDGTSDQMFDGMFDVAAASAPSADRPDRQVDGLVGDLVGGLVDGLVGSSRGSRSVARAVRRPPGPRVVVDPAASMADVVGWSWTGEATLRVQVPADASSPERSERLWVRVFDGDGTVLAASPLAAPQDGWREALLLVVPRSGLGLDVVASVAAPRVSASVAAFVSAAAAGRRAGSWERLGDPVAAAAAWEECAGWHRVAGDRSREAQARVRAASAVDADRSGVVTVADAVTTRRLRPVS